MVSTKISKLLLLCLNDYAFSAPQSEPEPLLVKAVHNVALVTDKFCDDETINFRIEIPKEQSTILRMKAGNCIENDGHSTTTYDDETGELTLSLPYEKCELKVYDHDQKYTERTGYHYFSTTIEVTFGNKANDVFNFEFQKIILAAQCGTKTKYEVEFDYAVNRGPEECQSNAQLHAGACVFFGPDNIANFKLVEYADNTFTEKATDVTKQTVSGNEIHLGIVANDIPRDYMWAVEACWIDTSKGRYDLINLVEGGGAQKCQNSFVELDAWYPDPSTEPQFRMKHILFMLSDDDTTSSYKLRCDIRLCCIGNEESGEGRCSDDDTMAMCRTSRDECTRTP